jgi:hypothetical protein
MKYLTGPGCEDLLSKGKNLMFLFNGGQGMNFDL